MIAALLALSIIQNVLLIVIALSQIELVTKVTWLKNVLIPFLSSLSRFINPEKQ